MSITYHPPFPKTVGPLIYEVPSRLAGDWLEFRVSDADMLAEYYAQEDNPPAIFIASLNAPNEVRTMLEICGRFYLERKTELTLFRASNPTVLRWADRFYAYKHTKTNHRARFMFYNRTNGEWRYLCVRAYLLSKVNQDRAKHLALSAKSSQVAATQTDFGY